MPMPARATMARHRAQASESRPAARAPKEVVEKAKGADGAAAPPVALAEAARAAPAKGQRKERKREAARMPR